MPLNNSLVKITDRLKPAAGGPKRDPRALWKGVIGFLAVTNIAAFFMLVRPPGGTVAELEEQLQSLRRQTGAQQAELLQAKSFASKLETARTNQEEFLSAYFLDRQTTFSTILTEIGRAAKEAGLKAKEQSFQMEPVEGSDNINMLTITANYEGNYGDLVHFVNLVDRSKRFLILDSIQAAPMQERGMLASRFKMNTFVRELPRAATPPAPVAAAPEPEKAAPPVVEPPKPKVEEPRRISQTKPSPVAKARVVGKRPAPASREAGQ